MLNKIKRNSYGDVHSKLTEAVDLKKIVAKCFICNTQNSDTTLWRVSNFMTSDPSSLHSYFIKRCGVVVSLHCTVEQVAGSPGFGARELHPGVNLLTTAVKPAGRPQACEPPPYYY